MIGIQVLNDAMRTVQESLKSIKHSISDIIRAIASLSKRFLMAVWQKVLLPCGVSGINILGYIGDKFLFGPPGLREFSKAALLPSDISPTYRRWVKNNAGWDIYTSVSPMVDNGIGFVLGFGLGILNYFSNWITSLFRNIQCTYNLLGSHGVFNERKKYQDQRPLALRIIFGITSSPFVFLTILVTNLADAVCTFAYHMFTSFSNSLRSTYNLLGNYGVFNERYSYYKNDERALPVKIIFGVLSAPLVFPLVLSTNILDAALTFAKHLIFSYWRNLKCIYNLLGEYGIFGGKRLQYEDPERPRPVKIIFGVLTAPFVFVAALVINIIDGICTFIKHAALSFNHNVRITYNLLGENGILGKRTKHKDDRTLPLPVKIVFDLLSLPFFLPVALVTNAFDAMGTFVYHFLLSFWLNLRSNYNLLGKKGVFGDRIPNRDERHDAVCIIFGVLSFPLVLPIATITNLFDAVCTFTSHFGRSIKHNLLSIYNLLGEHGVFGERAEYQDHKERSRIVRIIFGILSAPIVLPVALISNTLDGMCTFVKHLALSFWYQLHHNFNLVLLQNGVFGKRRWDKDERPKLVKVLFHGLAFPLALPCVLITNLVDCFATACKHFGLSFIRNLRSTYNLLGNHGVLNDRKDYKDERPSLAVKIVFGILSAPFVFSAALLTNTFDAICTFLKHVGFSFAVGLKHTYNLLDEQGTMSLQSNVATAGYEKGMVLNIMSLFMLPFLIVDSSLKGCGKELLALKDDRPLPVKLLFDVLAAPLVLPVMLITNFCDFVGCALSHFMFSVVRNFNSTYNLLGEKGVLGPKIPYKDDRPIVVRAIFGFLSFPIVAPFALITNIADLLGTAAKHTILKKTFWQHAAVVCLGIPALVITGPIAFLLRKTGKGFYNVAVRPFVNCAKGEKVNWKTTISGALNLMTFGIFGVAKKCFKGVTGYTSRFGFPSSKKSSEIPSLEGHKEVNDKFKEAIHLAVTGKFPNIEDGQGIFRSVMRLFYHMRHPAEKIVKKFHDTYLEYVKEVGMKEKKEDLPYSMHAFFKSDRCVDFRYACQNANRKDEENIQGIVEAFLCSPVA